MSLVFQNIDPHAPLRPASVYPPPPAFVNILEDERHRRLAVRQARVRISARHPMEAPLAERRRDEDSRRRASANGEG
jgi:hypothetical protein